MAHLLRRIDSTEEGSPDGVIRRGCRTTLLPPPPIDGQEAEEECSGLVRAVERRAEDEDDVLAWLDETLAHELDLGPDPDDEEDARPTIPIPEPSV